MTEKLKIQIDIGKAGVNLEVYGMSCKDPKKEAEKELDKLMIKLGIPKQCDKLTADCTTTLEDMKTATLVVICTDTCQPTQTDATPAFEKVKDTYTKDSHICAAAQD